MNIIRDGVILAVYTFSVLMAYIFLSNPFALVISGISSASDANLMHSAYNEVISVFSIATAMAVLIPSIVFIYLAFTTNREEYIY
jgi:hypothetical protein